MNAHRDWDRRHRLIQRLEISILYHHKRERFYDCLDKATKAISLIAGSAAFAAVGSDISVRIAAAIVAVTAAIGLVVGYAEKSRRHAELARSMRELQADCCGVGETAFEESHLNTWEARLHRIE